MEHLLIGALHAAPEHRYLDLQELAHTYQQLSLRKTQLLHRLLTHYLPLYSPEAERYLHSSRAEWWTPLMLLVPCPAAVREYSVGPT